MRRLRWIAVASFIALHACDSGSDPETYPALTLEAISAGGSHTCGLDAQGAALCWGLNAYGQLGAPVDSVPHSPVPLTTRGPVRFASVTAGLGDRITETCGVTATERAYCWGARVYYDVITWSADEPDSVPTTLTFQALQSGVSHLCGVASGGAAHCLGSNYFGELGTGLTASDLEATDTFVTVSGGHTFNAIAVGANFACGVDGGGFAWCWGDNTFGQLGAGDTTESLCGFFREQQCVRTPVAVAGGRTYRWLTAGRLHACGLSTTGTLYCWGGNGAGQLGVSASLPMCAESSQSVPSQPCATTPMAVSFPGGSQPLAAAAAGGAHTCALSVDGDLYCWGSDLRGQLGLGGSPLACGGLPCRTHPARVGAGYFFAVTVGFQHTCALNADSEAVCWGANDWGQLGDGSDVDRNRPIRVRQPI